MEFCPHSTYTEGHAENRSTLESRLAGIPENQGGISRHGCVYCAYERGWKDAEETIARRFNAMLESLTAGRVE